MPELRAKRARLSHQTAILALLACVAIFANQSLSMAIASDIDIAVETSRFDSKFGNRGVAFGPPVSTKHVSYQAQVRPAPDGSVWALTLRIKPADSDSSDASDSVLTHFNSRGKTIRNLQSRAFAALIDDRRPLIEDFSIDPKGRLLVLVAARRPAGERFKAHLIRLKANGILDRSFGVSGTVKLGISTGLLQDVPITSLPDGRTIVELDSTATLVFRENGERDLALAASFGQEDRLLGLGRGGKLYVQTIENSPNMPRPIARVVRLLPDGQLDSSWTASVTPGLRAFRELANGSVVAVTVDQERFRSRSPVRGFKYAADGTIDSTYGKQGTARIVFTGPTRPGTDFVATKILADGSIRVAGEWGPSTYGLMSITPKGRSTVGRFTSIGRLPRGFDSLDGVFDLSGDALYVYGSSNASYRGDRTAIARLK